VERRKGVRFRWRPFNARAIMQEMNNVPFATKPIKLAYMWRDLERRASLYGLPVKVPAPYPLKNFDLANRVAILGQVEGWCPDYVRATYRRWFVDGLEAGSEPNLSESLKQIGQDPDRVVTQALTDAVGWAYDGNTEEARSLKIFGAPTFVVRGELFWGDDRLDDAITWLSRGKLDPNN
jgi:2-hydroxychromene-2-carboxylate isomerase